MKVDRRNIKNKNKLTNPYKTNLLKINFNHKLNL